MWLLCDSVCLGCFPPLLCQHVTYMEINDFLSFPDPLSLNKGGVGRSQMPSVASQHARPTSRSADCAQGIPHRMDPTQANSHCPLFTLTCTAVTHKKQATWLAASFRHLILLFETSKRGFSGDLTLSSHLQKKDSS